MGKVWTATDGAWATSASWLPGGVPAPGDDAMIGGPAAAAFTILGPGSSSSLTLFGGVELSGSFAVGALSVGASDLANARAGARLVLSAGSTLAATSALLDYGSVTVSSTGSRLADAGALILGTLAIAGIPEVNSLALQGGATVQVGNLTMTAGADIYNAIRLDPSSSLEIGDAGAAATGTVTVDAGHTLRGSGSVSAPAIVNAGTIEAQGNLTLNASAVGSGVLMIDDGSTLALGSLSDATGNDVSFTGRSGTLALHSYFSPGAFGYLPNLSGTIRGFAAADIIRYLGTPAVTGASYAAGSNGLGTLTLLSGATAVGGLTLAGDYSGASFHVAADTAGGSAAITVTSAAPANAFLYTDTAAGASGQVRGDAYAGPVAGLQRQYIWPGADGVAIAAMVGDVFLHGGAGDDALSVSSGTNVLDGGTGSNFLTGATGADGGTDTFFVDGRGGGVTWSTVVNFHRGDAVTVFGFQAGVSTRPWTAVDGAQGYQGATIHAELGGAGTGVNASVTFAGISQADADAKFTVLTGTVGDASYLYVAYTG